MYLTVCAAGAWGLRNSVNRIKLIVAATAGILVSAGAVFGALYKAASPLDTVPWALGIWTLLGVIWAAIVARREPVATGPVEVQALTGEPK
jgi:hypothetical protein